MIIGMKTLEQIDAAIDARRRDTEFMERIRRIHERERALFDYLALR